MEDELAASNQVAVVPQAILSSWISSALAVPGSQAAVVLPTRLAATSVNG